MDIRGSAVLITGAARGLGAAMARTLAAGGARLALVDLSEESLLDIRDQCTAVGAEVYIHAADVAREDQVVALYERAAADLGGLDVSVANAGILRDAQLIKVRNGEIVDRMSLQQWQSVIDVNLTGVFLCGREAATQMLRSGRAGCIVNISSISRHGNFGQSNYSAAKAGVAALTRVWSKELARYSIRVNAIAPGFVRTEMVAGMKPEMLQKMSAGIPLQRLGEPEEIAQTLAYIIGNDYLNGSVIEVDGGQRL